MWQEDTRKSLFLTAILVLTAALPFAVAQPLESLGSLTMTPRTGVTAVGEQVYCVGNNNLSIVDVSNPASPALVGQVAPGVPGLVTVQVGGDFAYCAGGAAGLVVIEVSNPQTPVWRANLAVAGSARDAVVTDTIVAVATSANVTLVGVRSPLQPHVLATYGRASSSVRFNALGTTLFVGSQTGAFALHVETYDSAGATRYRLTAADDYGAQSMTPHDVAGAYVTYARGADVVALRASNFTLAGTYSASSAIRAVAAGSGFSFIALATGSLQYLDQRGDTPDFVAAAGLPTTATGLALAHGGGQPLIVASTANGLSIFSYTPLAADDDSRPLLPRELTLSAYPNPFNGAVTLKFAVPAAGDYTLELFDLSGRLLSSERRFLNGTSTLTLDFSPHAAGVYLANLRCTTTHAATKLLYLP